jgi:protease PrsW
MIGIAPRVVGTAFDGFIIGAMAGLGFQVFENVLYVFQAAQSSFGQTEPGLVVAGSRIGFGFFSR